MATLKRFGCTHLLRSRSGWQQQWIICVWVHACVCVRVRKDLLLPTCCIQSTCNIALNSPESVAWLFPLRGPLRHPDHLCLRIQYAARRSGAKRKIGRMWFHKRAKRVQVYKKCFYFCIFHFNQQAQLMFISQIVVVIWNVWGLKVNMKCVH